MSRPQYPCILLVFVSLCCAALQSYKVCAQIPLDTTYTVASTYKKLIKTYPNIKTVHSIPQSDVKEIKDIVYLTIPETPFGRRDLHLDLFLPGQQPKSSPVIIIVHGGGWRSGNKSLNTPLAQRLASAGFAVASVEYRLSLEARYPAAIQDVMNAIRWIREHANQYNIDSNQIAIAGSSAGGQLASLIGVANENKTFQKRMNANLSSQVQAVIDMDGLLDFTDAESLTVKRNENSADVFWLQGSYEQIPDRWKEASPLYWVDKNAPPFLFINSSQTRFHAGCANMVKELERYGIYYEVHKLDDAPHSYWFFHPWFEPTALFITTFLNKVFNLKG